MPNVFRYTHVPEITPEWVNIGPHIEIASASGEVFSVFEYLFIVNTLCNLRLRKYEIYCSEYDIQKLIGKVLNIIRRHLDTSMGLSSIGCSHDFKEIIKVEIYSIGGTAPILWDMPREALIKHKILIPVFRELTTNSRYSFLEWEVKIKLYKEVRNILLFLGYK